MAGLFLFCDLLQSFDRRFQEGAEAPIFLGIGNSSHAGIGAVMRNPCQKKSRLALGSCKCLSRVH